jgi:hypothetical protein
LLRISSAVSLGLSPAGLISFIFLSFIERERERRERGKKVGGDSEKHYIEDGVEKTVSSV